MNSLINGVAADYLNINDRAIHYGDGLFETILCANNKLFYWQQHYQRLQTSARQLKLSCPDEQVLLNDIVHLLEENKKSGKLADKQAYAVKIIVTRGTGERGYRFVKGENGNRLVLLSEIKTEYSSLLSAQLLSGELCVCEQQVSINENLAGLKHLNRLENVMARNEWGRNEQSNNEQSNNEQSKATDNKFIDGLMVNANQHVIEGTMSNLFAVKDNQLLTPDLKQSGVNGIMREVIIDLAKKNNIQTSPVNISLDELHNMDELFISNSLIGMKSVNKLGGSTYKKHSITNNIFNNILKTMNNHAQTV